MNRKKILVTGGSGYIGINLIECLLDLDYEIHSVGRSEGMLKFENKIFWHKIDLLNSDEIFILMDVIRPDFLIHLAWTIGYGLNHDSSENDKWLEVSKRIIKHFYTIGGRRSIIAGTCAEYDWSNSLLNESNTPLVPGNLYGKTKVALFRYLEEFCSESGFSWCWPRIFFSYGPHQNPKSIVPSVIKKLSNREYFNTTDGTQKFDYLYIKDVVKAIAMLVENNFVGDINICSGHPTSIKTILNLISEKMGQKELIRYGTIKKAADSPSLIVGDNSRLKKLGWSQKYNLEKGIKLAIKELK